MMKETIKYIVTFTVGAGIGSAVMWKLIKDRYERIANEEIESVKEAFTPKKEVEPEAVEEEKSSIDELEKVKELASFSRMTDKVGYTNYSDLNQEKEGTSTVIESVDIEIEDYQHIIDEDDFGELVGYDYESLTLYTDGVLADEQGEIVENIEATVGSDALDRLKNDPDQTCIYVRNDNLDCDYEIFKEDERYADIYNVSVDNE